MTRQSTTVIIISFLLLAFTTVASANGTDSSGTALRTYVENYLENASPTDPLAAKINAAGGANAWGVNEWLCSLEVAATLSIGYRIWETRMRSDSYYLKNFTKTQFIPLNIANYCIIYSNSCDHWTWNQNCIRNKFAK